MENDIKTNKSLNEEHCSIILVNWNGWKDTIECLETVLKQNYKFFDIIIVDNDSKDDSIEYIKKYATKVSSKTNTDFPHLVYPLWDKPITIIEIEHEKLNNYELTVKFKNCPKIFLIKSNKNLGFAKANNIAINFAMKNLLSKYLYILNNDTIIEKNTLSELITFKKNNPGFSILQSLIYHYDNPKKVWQAGGKILPWAQVKYYHEHSLNKVKSISFVSGCALFVTSDIITRYGAFTEKFFHGEEDFEYSLRMRKNKQKMGLVDKSIVYHKIAASVSKKWENNPARLINFALNRIINMRDYYKKYTWQIWRIFAILYFYYLLFKYYKLPFENSFLLIKEVFKQSSKLNKVTNENVKFILDNSGVMR